MLNVAIAIGYATKYLPHAPLVPGIWAGLGRARLLLAR
jgi:hypothetical protein